MTTWYKLIITIEALRHLPKEVILPGPCKPAPTYAITQSPLRWGSWKLLFSWLWKGNHRKMPDKKGLAHLGTNRPSSAQRPGWGLTHPCYCSLVEDSPLLLFTGWGLTPATVHWLRTHPCYCSLVEDSPLLLSLQEEAEDLVLFPPRFSMAACKARWHLRVLFHQPARVFSEVPSSLETL
jgi:hypothetical protein